MKRSRTVHLTLLSSLAATLISCSGRTTSRYCVDEGQAVVDERYCGDGYYSGGGGHIPYHWYYGGASGYVPMGTRLSGGSRSAPGGSYSTPSVSGTVRGGIGHAGEAASSSHGAHSGGGSAGE